jgi:hypothetical protein
MAGTVIARRQLSHTPLTDTVGAFADATNGNLIANSGGTIWRIANTDATPKTATFVPVTVVEDFTITHATYTVTNGTTVWIGKHDVQNFGANILISSNSALLQITAFEP